MTDLITLTGVACLLAGLYLWLGPAASLIALGTMLIYTGARMAQQEARLEQGEQTNEPD